MSKVGGQVGDGFSSDSSGESPFLQDKLLNLKVAQNRPYYAELTSRQKLNHLVLDSWTTAISAGNLVAAAAAAVTQFALWNPVGSGYDLELVEFCVVFTSGTLGIPPLFHGMAPGVPTLATSTGSAYSGYGGNSAITVAKWMSLAAGSALTGGAAPVPVKLIPVGWSAGTYASLAVGSQIVDHIDGKIIVAPGTMWVPLFKAAGTTMLGSMSVSWVEKKII